MPNIFYRFSNADIILRSKPRSIIRHKFHKIIKLKFNRFSKADLWKTLVLLFTLKWIMSIFFFLSFFFFFEILTSSMFFCIINVNEKCLSGFSEFIMSPLEYTPKLHPRHPLEILITKPPNGVFHKHREHGGWGGSPKSGGFGVFVCVCGGSVAWVDTCRDHFPKKRKNI